MKNRRSLGLNDIHVSAMGYSGIWVWKSQWGERVTIVLTVSHHMASHPSESSTSWLYIVPMVFKCHRTMTDNFVMSIHCAICETISNEFWNAFLWQAKTSSSFPWYPYHQVNAGRRPRNSVISPRPATSEIQEADCIWCHHRHCENSCGSHE